MQYKGGHIPLSLTRQCGFMYLNVFYAIKFGDFNTTQNMFKRFPKISGLENIAFVKD